MTEIVKGESYLLENFHEEYSKEAENQVIRFVTRIPGEDKTLQTTYNGTTIREVLKACYQCLGVLDDLLPCTENEKALYHIAHAISFLNKRERDRRKRDVHGKHLL